MTTKRKQQWNKRISYKRIAKEYPNPRKSYRIYKKFSQWNRMEKYRNELPILYNYQKRKNGQRTTT
jgi:hypothetical protein